MREIVQSERASHTELLRLKDAVLWREVTVRVVSVEHTDTDLILRTDVAETRQRC